jgi:hypothetical protein
MTPPAARPHPFACWVAAALVFASPLAVAEEMDVGHPVAPAAGRAPDVEAPSSGERLDYDTPRFEAAGFPLIGGNSDIGFEFGAVGTLTRLGGGARPYVYNMDLVLAASLKSGPDGTEITQQNYLWQIDVPHVAGSGVRLNPAVSYSRTVNQGYFGLGNGSSAARPENIAGEPGRYFQFDEREARVRELTRVTLHPPWDLMIATTYRYAEPRAYAGSKLATDAASGDIHGYRDMSLGVLGIGILYDTRDNEYFPHSGSFHQIGVRAVGALPVSADVHYAALGAVLAKYVPLPGRFVAAFRGVLDAEFGNVPFFDLYTGGPFQTYTMIGGAQAIRGVPEGRYLGPLKAVANAELRAMLVDFRLLGQSFHLGGNLLFDTGRLWSKAVPPLADRRDGTGVGLKWGAGGGAYLVWGQAAVFRVEAAYSPDAVSVNPKLPVGIYVADGVMF